MTPQQIADQKSIADQKAFHRAELERLDALEKAQRPALAACPFCGCEDIREEEEEFCIRITCSKCRAQARSIEVWIEDYNDTENRRYEARAGSKWGRAKVAREGVTP